MSAPDIDQLAPIVWDGMRLDDPASATDVPQLFRRYSAAEMATLPATFDWLVRGVLARPTYGQLAGEMKTLKTYIGMLVMVCLASGKPLFGQFAVPAPRPVVAYFGEGGRDPNIRRLRRVAAAVGVNLAGLPLAATYDVAPIASSLFQRSLARDLAEVAPALVYLDPLYAYHGAGVKASSLHEEGSLLTPLHSTCLDADASLIIVNHFNQTGNGADLKRITMTGGGEWSDSWLLVNHRTEPDVPAGSFRLRLAIGSRQWGGTTWDLDLDLGSFDQERGEHDGEIRWEIRPAQVASAEQEADTAATILEILEAHPWELTKRQLVELAGGRVTATRDLVEALTQSGQIKVEKHPRREAKRTIDRWLCALASEPVPDLGNVLDRLS